MMSTKNLYKQLLTLAPRNSHHSVPSKHGVLDKCTVRNGRYFQKNDNDIDNDGRIDNPGTLFVVVFIT